MSHYIIRKFFQKCNAIIASTADAEKYLRNIGVSKYIEVLSTGVDFGKYCNIEGSEIKSIMENYKVGKEFLLCSVSRLAKENIMKTIKSQKLDDVVKLIGSKIPDEIYKYYIASDIFVFASQSETQGMVLLEAMAGRCPVVAVRSSGIENIVKDGVIGYKTKADVKEWAEKALAVYYKIINENRRR